MDYRFCNTKRSIRNSRGWDFKRCITSSKENCGWRKTICFCKKRNTKRNRRKGREVIKISQDPVSLETPIGEEDDSHLGDFIKDERSLSPEEYATNEILKEEIQSVLSTLQSREQQVLELRFGLIDGTCYTLEEVGKRFNVTRERIRQIEAKALRKLRHPSRAKKLKDFMND